MSILSRALSIFRPRAEVVDSGKIKLGSSVWEALTGGFGGAPSEGEAMAVSAVTACVNLVSGAIAALPMNIYRRASDGDLAQDYSHPLWWMLNEEFCPRWSAAAGWEFLTASKLLHGNAYAEILRDRNGGVTGLIPLLPSRVRPIAVMDDRGGRLIYEVMPDPTITDRAPGDRLRVLDAIDMLHVPGPGYNGLAGISALRHSLRSSGRLAISAQEFSKNFLANAARPDFALKTAGNLTGEQFDQLRAMLDEHRSPANAGRPMILEGGLDVKELTMPMEDMQLLETRKFQVEEIARVFNVPPFMIGHTENTSSWGTGVEAMGAGFVRYTLRAHLNAFHNEINRKFFRRPGLCAEFDTWELERGDFKSMIEGIRNGIGRAGEQPIISREEGRQKLRMPKKIEGEIITPAAPNDPAQTGAGQ